MILLGKVQEMSHAKHVFENNISINTVEVAKTSLRKVAMQLLKLAGTIDEVFADIVEEIIK